MQVHVIPIFKNWVSEWLARSVIFTLLLTSLLGFALYYSNPESAIGYYGIEPVDVQYSVVLMYASVVTFLALDFRIIKFFSTRRYILIALILNAVTYLICFYTKDWFTFMICRFVQGIVCALLCSVVLNLVFPRLNATRSRVIGYTVFYGGLQISIPICAIYCSTMLHYLDFQWLFFGLLVLKIPVIVTVLVTMQGEGRLQKKLPLYRVDWIGYILYTLFCAIFGYILVYGQQRNWLEDQRIRNFSLAVLLVLILFIIRQLKLKRPLINLKVFEVRNFILGLLMLIAFYVFKGTTGFTYSYLSAVLGVDPINTIPIWIGNILSLVLATFVTARFVLKGVPLMRIIFCGFLLLAIFYIYMLNMISVTGETSFFILPIFIHGLACGILFVPLVIFTASSVSPKIAYNVSFVGIWSRFMGFCISIGINNYFQIYTRAAAREKVRESMSDLNNMLSVKLDGIQNLYANNGQDMFSSKAAGSVFFDNYLKQQIIARSLRDYHSLMLVGIVLLLLILLLLPSIRKVRLRLSKGNLPY